MIRILRIATLVVINGLVIISCLPDLKDTCIFIHHLELDHSAIEFEEKCTVYPVCNKTFNIIYIDKMPYTEHGIDYMLQVCCGLCVKMEKKVLQNITQLTPALIDSADFVYPVLASSSIRQLYGAKFLPYVEVPSIMYITKKSEKNILVGIFAMYPVIIVCLLMACVSGFVGWLLETWSNTADFPRPFLTGWFEGFWWSFVSMTTVGYGDKTPRTFVGRIFSVIWIIIGIVSFGILTGELTGQIVKANDPPPASMDGKRIGVLRYRDYDAYMISKFDGIVVRDMDSLDFFSNLFGLIQKLQDDDISGFVLDKWTLWYVTMAFQNPSSFYDRIGLVNFFLNTTTRVERAVYGEKLSFGMLVHHDKDYNYFQDFAEDSHLRSKMLYGELWMKAKMETFGDTFYSSGSSSLFDTSGPVFQKTIIAILGILNFIIVFGIVYEMKRRSCIF